MFQFRRFPTYTYLIQCTFLEYCSRGFPHSEIHGSMDICSSPWLIAACHVLLRLLMPRHSPCALISLTISLVLKELCRSQKFSISRSNCSFYPIIPQLLKCTHLSAPLLPCFFMSFLLCSVFKVQLRSKTGSKYSSELEYLDPFSGGDNRTRTDDPLRAKQVLSQLSYTPIGEKIGGP